MSLRFAQTTRVRTALIGIFSGAVLAVTSGCGSVVDSPREGPDSVRGVGGSHDLGPMSGGGTENSSSGGGTFAAGGAGVGGGPSFGGATSAGGATIGSGAVGSGGADDDRFGRGMLHVIPRRENDSLTVAIGSFIPDGFQPDEPLSLYSLNLLQAEGFRREYDLNVHLPGYLLIADWCEVPVAYGEFELTAVEVSQDVAGQGASLSVEPHDESFRLTFDGVGSHDLTYRALFSPLESDAQALNEQCPDVFGDSEPMEVHISQRVNVREIVSATVEQTCRESNYILSGERVVGISLRVFDGEGQERTFMNVYPPVDLTIESERAATITGDTLSELVVTGERQKVRVSAPFGPAGIFEIIEVGDINGWVPEFWSSMGASVKAPKYPFVPVEDGITVVPEPYIGLSAYVTVDGESLCSPSSHGEFFDFGLGSGCEDAFGTGGDFYLGRIVEEATEPCDIQIDIPEANHGAGLNYSLSVSLGM